MGIYYSANGSSFTSTLDIHPETFTKYNYDDDESDLDISYSDFTRVCNLLNSDKKDITAAIIIQRWWRNNQSKKYKKYLNATIIIQKWWKNIQTKNKLQLDEEYNINKFFCWSFLWL